MTEASSTSRKTSSDAPVRKRRRYHSPLREQQAAETRERIIASGARLVRGLGDWDWKNLTARAVAEGAGVSERTVHRHFATERLLRDAVLMRLSEESGINLENLDVSNFAVTTEQLFKYLTSFVIPPAPAVDPSLATMDERRRMALLAAVANDTPGWPDSDREIVAAVLDIAWHLPNYERLQTAWELEPERAIEVLSWLIELVEDAIRDNRRPGRAKKPALRRVQRPG